MIGEFPEIWYLRFGVREDCRGEQGAREIGGVATDYFTALRRNRFDKACEDSLGRCGPQVADDRHPLNSTNHKLKISPAFEN